METLLARYFDGDLDENEARKLLEAVESDPELEKELRAYEQVLALGKKLPGPKAPAGFTGRVMAEITAAAAPGGYRRRGRHRPALFSFRWVHVAAAAAAVAIAFAGGWWASGDGGRRADAGFSQAASTGITPVSARQASAPGNGYHYVRLVYVPVDRSVENVHVVGSFNGWDPGSTPLRREGDVFSTILYLPPGSYEYMFVIDGREWVTDPTAVERRDDGFGGSNAVLDVFM